MRRIIGSSATSGLVGVCFTSAVIVAQAGAQEGQPAPAPDDKVAAELSLRAKARLVVAQKAVVGQANRLPVINQFTQQARPLLRAELIFARNVCDLNRDELRKVNIEAQKMLDEVVAKMVDAQFQPRARVNGQGRMTNSLDAQQLLEEGVVSIMKKNLSAPQWTVYEVERQKRDENRKRATIRYFVDAIDRELYLTSEQCKKLEVSLNENWDSTWPLYLENHLFGNKYYPTTIDPAVLPLLTNAQSNFWRSVQKVGIDWGFGGMLAGFANDGDELEAELGEPMRPRQAVVPAIPGMDMQQLDILRGGVVIPPPPVAIPRRPGKGTIKPGDWRLHPFSRSVA